MVRCAMACALEHALSDAELLTALNALHIEAGRPHGALAGFSMPVQYKERS